MKATSPAGGRGARDQAGIDRLLDQPRLLLAGQLVAQPQEGELAAVVADAAALVGLVAPGGQPAAAAGGHDLVERGDLVAGADLAGVDRVVVEILLAQRPVLIADQPVFADIGRVELDLDLDVLGDGEQRRGELLDEHLLRLARAVDVGVVAVPVVGDLLHHRFVVIAGAEAERGQGDARPRARARPG